MKRLSLALLLAIGALVLVFGSSSGSTPVALAATDACGVEGLDVPDTGDSFDFTAACQAHDDCYAAGGGPFARARCDNQFLRDMNNWCTSHWASGDPNLTHCKAVALTYYTAVRLGGWIFFYS